MKKKKANEFRKLNDKEGRGHPQYIYAKVGKRYKFIGITHAEITNGMRNIPLDKNPNPQDNRKAYMRTEANEKDRSKFGGTLKGWRLSDTDKPKAQKIIFETERKKSHK